MNIFMVDNDPAAAAQALVDKHVVKMILESAQLLSTAHRVLDGKEEILHKYVPGSLPPRYRKQKVWKLTGEREAVLYKATHINHPSAIWCRENIANYSWLFMHFLSLLSEYRFRYGKNHKCEDLIQILMKYPRKLPYSEEVTPLLFAMPEEYIISDDPVESYRNYYRKGKSHLAKWTKTDPPEWYYRS